MPLRVVAMRSWIGRWRAGTDVWLASWFHFVTGHTGMSERAPRKPARFAVLFGEPSTAPRLPMVAVISGRELKVKEVRDVRSRSSKLRAASPSLADRVKDARRYAGTLSDKARHAKAAAEDVIDDGVHAARRVAKSVRRGVERIEDVKDEGIYYVKRRPLKAVSLAAVLGVTVGLFAGWMVGRFGSGRMRTD